MKKPRYPRCIFCEKNDSESSKEDVMAKWIARELPGMKKALYRARTGKLGDPDWPSMEFGAVGKFGWETPGPCKRCNNGWMSDLETAVKPTIRPMLHGHDCRVDSAQLMTVAQWFLKTTLMWEYLRYKSHRFFSRSDRRALFQSRAIPVHTFIYAARYMGGAAVYSIGGPMTIHFPGTPTKSRGYCATMAIGQLVLQVLSFKRPENVDETLNIRIPSRWEPIHKPVWPLPPGWSWPPSVVLLNNDEFKAFATRVPIRIR